MLACFGASLFNQAAGFGAVVRVLCFEHCAERVGLGFAFFEFITSLNVGAFCVRHGLCFRGLFDDLQGVF